MGLRQELEDYLHRLDDWRRTEDETGEGCCAGTLSTVMGEIRKLIERCEPPTASDLERETR